MSKVVILCGKGGRSSMKKVFEEVQNPNAYLVIRKELKKGNHTLTLKVKSLEDTVAFQDLEIIRLIRLREENNSLKAELLESILKIEEREGE